jgi:peptidoglycan/LPS O-acetylase OafA/YrhL
MPGRRRLTAREPRGARRPPGPADLHLPRRLGSILLTLLFAILSIADAWQLGQAALGRHPDPPGLLVTHGLTGVLAAAAAVGSWQVRRWATLAALAWGVATAAMLVALGPLLDTPPAERPQLWASAAVVLFLAGAAGWYLYRRDARER